MSSYPLVPRQWLPGPISHLFYSFETLYAISVSSRMRMLAIKYFSLTEAHRFSTAFTQDGCYGWRPGWNSQALLMVAASFSHRAEMAMVRSCWE